ncbi:hypothetical protein N8I77_002238 [Diaporthe amygdali]|uniref:Uncharacterized protein n=1 Tax=Phomopsis amygdali TaxID=1214568 RepID=A0AAD9SQJ2_PHOAM|nr:hypothetical protein N8I77_002238 [Diaporthe amygdali]
MAKPTPRYQAPGRVPEIDRTPRAYTAESRGRDSYLARPPPVHETSSDAKSWSRQTEDALDAYRQRDEKHHVDVNQTMSGSYKKKSDGPEKKLGIEVTEYRLDSGDSDIHSDAKMDGSSKRPYKTASSYFATYIEAEQVGPETAQNLEAHHEPPKNHRMTKMIVKEDIDFFTALLEGQTPPVPMEETQAFVHDETETQRRSEETREREVDMRRREEEETAKADTDFFLMLMHKE